MRPQSEDWLEQANYSTAGRKMRHDPVIVASPPKARGPKTLASGVRASGSRVRGHPSSAAAWLRAAPLPLLLAISLAVRLTGNLLHECHANAVGAQDPTLHQLPYQPHQLQERGREVRSRACGPWKRTRPPPYPLGARGRARHPEPSPPPRRGGPILCCVSERALPECDRCPATSNTSPSVSG